MKEIENQKAHRIPITDGACWLETFDESLMRWSYSDLMDLWNLLGLSIKKQTKINWFALSVVVPPGFEPRHTESKSVVLPLYYGTKVGNSKGNQYNFKNRNVNFLNKLFQFPLIPFFILFSFSAAAETTGNGQLAVAISFYLLRYFCK